MLREPMAAPGDISTGQKTMVMREPVGRSLPMLDA